MGEVGSWWGILVAQNDSLKEKGRRWECHQEQRSVNALRQICLGLGKL